MSDKIHVFKVQDGDWIAARTAKQALNEQVRESGEQDYLLSDTHQLSDSELDLHAVLDEAFNDQEPVTFRVALDRLIKVGASFPRVLATLED